MSLEATGKRGCYAGGMVRSDPAFGGRSWRPGGRAVLGHPLSNERIGAATDFFLGGSLAPIGVTVSFLSATPGMNSIG
jgi:hypothetical protein